MSETIKRKRKDRMEQAESRQVQLFRKSVYRAMSSGVLQTRSEIASRLGKTFGGKRDIYEALGYPKMNSLKYEDYYAQYRRGDIAGRLIDAPVDGSWEQTPSISESEDEETAFEKAFEEMVDDIGLWRTLIRADKLTGIGRYGVLLLGFSDVKRTEDLKEPVKGTKNKLLYLQPFGEGSAEVTQWVKDANNKRFGLPEVYRLTQEEPGVANSTKQIEVHWTRVIHIAEGLLESNTFGLPALERVYNRILNLEIIVGGSAEMFWQGAFPGYAFIADGDADMTQAKASLETEIDLFVHDFKRYMKLQGLKVEKMSSDVASPQDHVDVQLKMISIASGIPKRILEGSERGELSSSQDVVGWNKKLNSRRIHHNETDLLRPLIDRLILYGALPTPRDGYIVYWPDLNSPSDKDKAEVGKILSEAIKNYYSGLGTEEIPIDIYFEEVLGYERETAEKIMEAIDASRREMIPDQSLEEGMTEQEDVV